MSGALVIVLYLGALLILIESARQFSLQYHQPWVPLLVIAGCCFLTARYIARSL